jgi:hypothetical protein
MFRLMCRKTKGCLEFNGQICVFSVVTASVLTIMHLHNETQFDSLELCSHVRNDIYRQITGLFGKLKSFCVIHVVCGSSRRAPSSAYVRVHVSFVCLPVCRDIYAHANTKCA